MGDVTPAVGDRVVNGRHGYGTISGVHAHLVTLKFSWGHVVHSEQLRWDAVGGTWVWDEPGRSANLAEHHRSLAAEARRHAQSARVSGNMQEAERWEAEAIERDEWVARELGAAT